MQYISQFLFVVVICSSSYAQVGINIATPDTSAMLDVYSTEKGFLPPRMLEEDRDEITLPATGLVIYNLDKNCLQVNNGTPSAPNWLCLNGESDSGNTLPSIPSSITIAQDILQVIGSVFDEDYLPYSSTSQPTGSGLTDTFDANGSLDNRIDIQGELTTDGITFTIPVTTTGSDVLPAYSTTINIPANLTEDGVSRDVTFSWEEQSYADGATFITAKLQAVGGTLNVKKLDLNRGFGTDKEGVLLANFDYPFNSDGNLSTLGLRAVPGIPDRNFSDPNHRFIYLPVASANGRIWLNNNLGAAYSDLNSPVFNPAQQATSTSDSNAFGSLYNWGRFSDGHELRSSTITTTRFTTFRPDSDVSVMQSSFYDDTGQPTELETLWVGEQSVNNPCPVGFRLPISSEWGTELASWPLPRGTSGAIAGLLKISAGGRRVFSTTQAGTFIETGVFGWYWTDFVTSTGVNVFALNITGTATSVQSPNIRFSLSVRCIQDEL